MKDFITKYQKYLTKRNTAFVALSLILLLLLPVIVLINARQNLKSNAAGAATIEAENGTAAGAVSIVNDANASGGKYVKFGNVMASGPELYVATTGSDSNTCTQAAPCKTLVRADSLATPGTTIHVAPGSYTGPSKLQKAGSATARIRFVSDVKWGAKLSTTTGIPVHIVGSYIDFEGFDVTGSSLSSNVIIGIDGNYSRVIGNYVHTLPIGCTSSSGGAGIEAAGWLNGGYNGHDQEIIGNLVEDIGTGPRDGTCGLVHGIYVSVPYGKVINNIVRRATGAGIHAWHAATNLLVINNTSVANGGSGIIIGNGDDGGSTTGNHDSYVANNIAVGNAEWAITECCDATFHGPNYYVNNLSWNNRYNGIGNISRGGTQTGSVTADPKFVSLTGGDYHLLTSSPAIDTGTSTNAPSTDYDGVSRPQGTTFDRGAYEFH